MAASRFVAKAAARRERLYLRGNRDIRFRVTFGRNGGRVDSLTTITPLGTPLGITLQEPRIETISPVNTQRRRALARIVSGNALE